MVKTLVSSVFPFNQPSNQLHGKPRETLGAQVVHQPAEASLKRQLDEDGRSLSAEKNRQRAATVLKAKLQGDRSWKPDHV